MRDTIYENVTRTTHQLQRVRAKELFKLDVDYISPTARCRSSTVHGESSRAPLERGLHQAVEAKEKVKIKEENQTLATVTLQNYFRMYDKLSGMTGTVPTEAGECAHLQPPGRVDPDEPADDPRRQRRLHLQDRGRQVVAAVDDITERKRGQPVLVGTISVEKSEKLSRLLEKRASARGAERQAARTEAEIVTQAGQPRSVTVATNMAGRRRHPARRQPRRLAAPSACEGLTLDSEEYDGALQGAPAASTTSARPKATRCALGGLYVLGTERHESAHRQPAARRSGRQGDPGDSRFYLSLEDELMRLFATGLMSRVMTRRSPTTRRSSRRWCPSVERAQGTVEDRNFEIRKNVLKYDEVMNEQRKVIYKRRQQILDGEDLREEAVEAITSAIGRLVDQYCQGEFTEEWDVAGLLDARLYFLTRITKEQVDECSGAIRSSSCCLDDALGLYDEKEESIGSRRPRHRAARCCQ